MIFTLSQMRGVAAAFAVLILLSPAPAQAQGAKVSSPVELARVASHLKPGEWVWAPQISPEGPLLIYVDLSRQLATVYRNGIRIAVSTISSGKPGHATPTGVFTILQKDIKHRSSKYNNAPMPYQQRLTWDGVALHAGGLPGYPESHGCIHLPYTFSQVLFGVTSLGATVIVAGNAQLRSATTPGTVLAPIDGKGEPLSVLPLDSQEYRWQPELSPTGPLTIVISKKDQAIVVLRNGIEIGRSVAQLDPADADTHVLHFTMGADGKPEWRFIGVPGHEEEEGRVLDQATAQRLRLPRGFYASVQQELQPGATILVTGASIGEGDAGRPVTILDAVSPGAASSNFTASR